MRMKTDLRKAIYSFNGYNRDVWVARMAQTVPSGSDVLDAGAGTGLYSHLFAHCNYKTQDFCQDPSTQGKYIKMDYVCDITDIPVSDESFDVIICTEVLEHVPEPIKAVQEFARILRPGGQLFITAPLGCGLHQVPYIFYGGYTPYWYEKFLPTYGFENLKITPNRNFFGMYSQESRRFMKLLFPRERETLAKVLTFPLKLLLSLWFRKIIPVSCYLLDKYDFDKDKKFTVEYFVEASKKKGTG